VITALLDHLWQSTLFAGAIALSMPLFRRQAASLRFWLWFTASMKFLFPFALLTLLGRDLFLLLSPATMPAFAMIHPAAAHLVTIATPLAAPAPARIPAVDLALVLWAAGFVAIALRTLSRWLDLRAILKDADPVAMDAPVPVKSAPSFLEPGLVGLWRPTILLPIGLAQHLTQAEMDAVLAHELCHLRRHDNLLTALHMLVEGLFWFHPLVWWIGQRLCEERERACDESVLAGGVQPLVYADGILKTCRFYVQSPLACASGVSGADLKLRIGAIIADRPMRALPPGKAMLLTLAAGVTLMLPLGAGLMGSSPAIQIARHVVTLLSTRNIEIPTLATQGPVMLSPAIQPARPVRHHMVAALPITPPIAEPAMLVRPPVLQIHTELDSRLPALPALNDSEDALVCRRPELLTGSRLPGPEICLRASQWAKLRTDGLDVSPDGKNIIRSDYEKQKTLAGGSCPQALNVGASTGWSGGSVSCF